MTRVEQFEAKQAEKRRNAEREDAFIALMPAAPAFITSHRQYVATQAGDSVRPEKWLKPAAVAEWLRHLEPHLLHSECWEAGCVSCMPRPINSYAEKEGAKQCPDSAGGNYAMELRLETAAWDSDLVTASWIAWLRLGDDFCKVTLPMDLPRAWRPTPRYEETPRRMAPSSRSLGESDVIRTRTGWSWPQQPWDTIAGMGRRYWWTGNKQLQFRRSEYFPDLKTALDALEGVRP